MAQPEVSDLIELTISWFDMPAGSIDVIVPALFGMPHFVRVEFDGGRCASGGGRCL